MAIVAAFMVPHPPIAVAEVGKGEEKKIDATLKAYEKVAEEIKNIAPDTIVVISPHTVAYSDYFHISPGAETKGNLGQFAAPQVQFECKYDEDFVTTLCNFITLNKVSAGTEGEQDRYLDHGTMVPLYFINKAYKNYKLVRIGLSGLSLTEHYRLGQLIKETAKTLDKKVVIVASGDLSHRLKKDGPYGLNPKGAIYDKKIMEVMGGGNFLELLVFPPALCEAAGECGHRSFTIMAGALDKTKVEAQQLSYEGTFGVGYGISTFKVLGEDKSRNFLEQYLPYRDKLLQEKRDKEDPYVKLARASLEGYVKTGKKIKVPENILPELINNKAGTFVSLKKDGILRGCIGTIGPVRDNIAEEIICNAISSGTEDPRFLEVKENELPELEYSVDVLGPLEDISSPKDLDTTRYGVIVTKGSRTGLLLPNLEGVDTVEKQIDIAKQKAGIFPEEMDIKLQRFEVIRHK